MRTFRPVFEDLRWVLVSALLLAAGCNDGTATPVGPTTTIPFSQTDLRTGTGADAAAGKRLTVDYTGWLYDASKTDLKGQVFDTSAGRGPFSFTLGAGQVIKGFDQGFTGMKVGGLRRLVIPPDLAYCTAGVPGRYSH